MGDSAAALSQHLFSSGCGVSSLNNDSSCDGIYEQRSNSERVATGSSWIGESRAS